MGDLKRMSRAIESLIESVKIVLIVYAASSELVGRLFEGMGIVLPVSLGRLVVAAIGMAVCVYAWRETRGSMRCVLTVAILFILGSIAVVLWELARSDPVVRPYFSSVEVSSAAWTLAASEKKEGAKVRVYAAQIRIPQDVKRRYQDIKVFIEPSGGFRLWDVQPQAQPGRAVPREQEPLEVGKFEDTRSEWLFPFFDEALEWRIVVKIEERDAAFRRRPPIRATVYFS